MKDTTKALPWLCNFSFCSNNPSPQPPINGTKCTDFLWFQLSFVVRSKANGKIVGASFNVDTASDVDLSELAEDTVLAINDAVESPVKEELMKGGGKWIDSFMLAVHTSIQQEERIRLIEVI